jgi:hypothetical protein
MKQYVCIKEYVTEEGDVAYRLGKVYDLEKHKMLASEISGVKYYFSSDFKKTYFKKHKPMTSFGGNGLYVASIGRTALWTTNDTTSKDSVVEAVVKKFQDRSRVGIEKYGTTLAGNDSLTTLQWIDEAQAEAMDFCLYLERLKKQF